MQILANKLAINVRSQRYIQTLAQKVQIIEQSECNVSMLEPKTANHCNTRVKCANARIEIAVITKPRCTVQKSGTESASRSTIRMQYAIASTESANDSKTRTLCAICQTESANGSTTQVDERMWHQKFESFHILYAMYKPWYYNCK